MRISRRTRSVGAVGSAAVVLAVGGLMGAYPTSATANADAPPSIEENFVYPGGETLDGIRLLKGDGHVLLTGCDQPARSIEVWSFTRSTPFCFEVRGTSGYVTLELADVYGIRNYNSFGLGAKVRVASTEKTISVPIDDWAGVGIGAGEGPAVLLELRA
ncbi:hypothetical protein [Micromonospora sp. NPDC049645]|uniref:hypothetical protein n=1 Tax=Micromonospora sp. NPDC049645 TaxID=3155508 RepID=UPI00341CF832